MDNSLIVDGELILYGPVGFHDFWEGAGFTSADVVNALAEMDGDITVRINSGGGVATEGAAIYNSLKRHDGNVAIVIDGIAASAASLIAMAGDTVSMPLGSLMMIHEPAGITLGPADAHRKNAAALDVLTGVYAQVYTDRSGQTDADVRAMMKAETWLSPDDAVAKGFATAAIKEGDPAVADASFDYQTYKHAPAHLAALSADRKAASLPMVAVLAAPQSTKEKPMSNTNATAADKTKTAETEKTDKTEKVENTTETTEATMTGDAVKVKIYQMAGRAKMDFAATEKLIKDAAGSIEKATALIIDAIADRDADKGQGGTKPFATVTADERDRFRQGVEKSLMSKAGLQGGEVNEFSSMNLREIARMSLDKAGIKLVTGDPMVMVGAALGMRQFVMAGGQHTTSDFVEVLANVANKSMLKGYLEAEETYAKWTAKGSLSDFKPAKRVDLNLFPSLAEVPEGGEYTYATIGDRGESIQLATYGKMFAITRQAIINDDMSVFTRIPSRMGRAANRTVGNLVYAVLTANAAMSDGIALFHTNHKNIGTGAITMAALDAGKSKMALQKDPDSIAAGLNIRPAYFLVPVELDGQANALMASQYAPGTTTDPNIVKGLAEVVSDARLSADSALKWYLSANPNATDTIEVSYLNGVSQPMLEQKDGWNVDGVEFKVRLDAGVNALDFRGLYRSTGA
ncbi:Clp protease ClpP [Mesorhizobium sp. M00.F.Ca.ET.186.01.1.1]|nr:Clp protease ClpP [bacterium M00.F.Ca.ET.205.01.1.1]TGU52990.1 Clp protease ClpP [bacterium M00.F.Ca.ET.152.01.1.1]TGV35959.1 Clp protease ClpP [Mesorhizobium sp. M00.F.Ca.ET.186.01.1.1]TGZ43542.1 Clp protease ClpP [bacterium M00.F.Ca.ET.162.01.1.1]